MVRRCEPRSSLQSVSTEQSMRLELLERIASKNWNCPQTLPPFNLCPIFKEHKLFLQGGLRMTQRRGEKF